MADVGTTDGWGRDAGADGIFTDEETKPTAATGREWVIRLTGVGRPGLVKDPIEHSR